MTSTVVLSREVPMSGITAVLNLQGRARRNALSTSRVLQLRRAQQQESDRAGSADAHPMAQSRSGDVAS